MAQALQEQKEGKAKLGALELGRFIAALMVMLSHAAPYVNNHAAAGVHPILGGLVFPGPLGVQYFFVLSGFVMASAHHGDFGKPFAPFAFWWRRICRIYPAYWLALCIPAYFLFHAMTPGATLRMGLLDPWYDQDYIPATWTMRLEMAFYMVFGLSLLPYIGKPILALWVALTFWHICDPTQHLLHPSFTMPFYWLIQNHAENFFSFMEFYFFAGLAAGFIYARWGFGRQVSIALMSVSLIAFIILLPIEDWGRSYTDWPNFMILMAIVIGGCILGLALLERHNIIRLGKYAAWAGAMSYPLYVFHEPVLLFININFPWGQHHTFGLYARFIAITVAILAVTALVTVLYDQPVQRLLRRLTKKVKGQGLRPWTPLGPEAPDPR